MIGTNSRCPLCGKETELLLATPEPIEFALPPRIIVWTVIAVVILGAGLAGSLVALKQARSWVENRRPPATLPTAKAVSEPGQRVLFELNGIQVTALSVEKPRGGGMAYTRRYGLRNRATRESHQRPIAFSDGRAGHPGYGGSKTRCYRGLNARPDAERHLEL